MKICISRMDKMGDLILTLPVVKSIKNYNPTYEIHVVASNLNSKVLKNLRYIDKIIVINKSDSFKTLISKFMSLRKEKYDIYLNFSPNILSYIFCFFSQANKKGTLIFLSRYKKKYFSKLAIRIFAKIFCNYSLTINRYQRLKEGISLHQTKMMFELLNLFKINNNIDTDIDINLPDSKLKIGENQKKILMIHLNIKWINKYYNEKDFLNLISFIPFNKYNCVLTSDQQTKNKFFEIYKNFKIINNQNFNNVRNLDQNVTIFDELNYDNWLKTIYSSSTIITPECGCTHLAAACKVLVNIIYDYDNMPEAINKEYYPWQSNYNKFIFNDKDLNQKIINKLL